MAENIKILVVDDEIDFLDTIAVRLQMRGFEVTKAPDGETALRAAETNKFDIALLDLKMPGLDGFQVLEKLKEKHDHLEVIILTAHGSVESAFTTSKQGAYDFMTKPYDFDELIIKIRQAYEKRLKKKFSNNKELFDKILNLSSGIPLGAESSLDLLEQLKKYDDHHK
jgi:DNA-binding NtrC family response regulator